MRIIAFVGFFCLAALFNCGAQIDTEFWFAPPEITFGHGDAPILVRISTQNEAANVRILRPAMGNMELANFNIPPATTRTINLSNTVSNIETIIPDQVMKTGIKVISSAPITAYYEEGSSLNGEIFVLKGRNALGRDFVIPWQNVYDNSTDYSPTPYASFDIVATQDNTVVTVHPTRPIFGHETDSVIVVKLNAGETYSFKKPSQSAAMNPVGTTVTSTKPIAITLKDDSVIKSTCRDVIGDQLIPVKVTGTEYIVPRGFLNAPEYLFITATEDDTDVFLSGISAPVRKLKRGELYRLEMTIPSIYIRATKRIYVLQVSGFGCEVGMAVLPPINCTGSKEVGFTRSTDEFFGMNILVKKEGIFDFLLNGTPISASNFIEVAGTNDEWYAAQVGFSVAQVPVNQTSTISNSAHSFQAGIINGNAGTTCRYGYFSSFSTLFIGDDFAICTGQTATLDAGPGKESYLWSTGEITQSIEVADEGDYWVTVTREDCVLSDTIHMDVKDGMEDLGPDVSLCPGDSTNIDGKENFSWLWSDGTTEQYLHTTIPGKYWVSVFDDIGCQASDTIVVSQFVSVIDELIDIELRYVTVDTAEQSTIRVAWTVLHPENVPENIVSLYSRKSGSTEWEFISDFKENVKLYADAEKDTEHTIFEYYASVSDKCHVEQKESTVHNTMLLTGIADSLNDVISVQWNPYREWKEGVERYELWRKLEDRGGYKLVSLLDAADNNLTAKLGTDGFVHQYIIRAIENQGESESWSNHVRLIFQHPITVPNVFTPNGDMYNQFFYIPKIELYQDSQLLVFDRWGMKVFDAVGYKNDWDGEGLSSGVYYYLLDLRKDNKTFKGIVNIIK